MKRFVSVVLLISVALASAWVVSSYAQSDNSSWPYFVELQSTPTAAGLYDLTVPLEVMDKSRADLSDLRLYDGQGKEIPYALRIRKEIDESRVVGGTLFNQASVGTATEVAVDLGEDSGEHNEVEIETAGTNFRRRVTVEGGDTGTDWKTLQSEALIFGFESQNKTVRSNRVSYPTSRYRFLRVRVFGDELTDKAPPTIISVNALKVLRATGEITTWNVNVPGYQLVRNEGAPASAWSIDLGAYVPCDRLVLSIEEPSFSRAFDIEAVDDTQNARLVASGELSRRVGEEIKPITIMFDEEEHVRKLRLVTTDHSNRTLSLIEIKAGAPARQLVFELKETPALPLRLFYGNPHGQAPHYDFEKDLLAKLAANLVRVSVGPATGNPNYRPEPLALTERIPWLIYIILAVSSIALGIILWRLARSTMSAQPNQEEHAGPSV